MAEVIKVNDSYSRIIFSKNDLAEYKLNRFVDWNSKRSNQVVRSVQAFEDRAIKIFSFEYPDMYATMAESVYMNEKQEVEVLLRTSKVRVNNHNKNTNSLVFKKDAINPIAVLNKQDNHKTIDKDNNVMENNVLFLNSKKASVQVSENFSADEVAVAKLAKNIGQYGNIVDYEVVSDGVKSAILFTLQEDADEYLIKHASEYSENDNQQEDASSGEADIANEIAETFINGNISDARRFCEQNGGIDMKHQVYDILKSINEDTADSFRRNIYASDEIEFEVDAKYKFYYLNSRGIEANGFGINLAKIDGNFVAPTTALEMMVQELGEAIPEFDDEAYGIHLYFGSTANMGSSDILVDYINDVEGVDDVVYKINNWLDANVKTEGSDGEDTTETENKVTAGMEHDVNIIDVEDGGEDATNNDFESLLGDYLPEDADIEDKEDFIEIVATFVENILLSRVDSGALDIKSAAYIYTDILGGVHSDVFKKFSADNVYFDDMVSDVDDDSFTAEEELESDRRYKLIKNMPPKERQQLVTDYQKNYRDKNLSESQENEIFDMLYKKYVGTGDAVSVEGVTPSNSNYKVIYDTEDEAVVGVIEYVTNGDGFAVKDIEGNSAVVKSLIHSIGEDAYINNFDELLENSFGSESSNLRLEDSATKPNFDFTYGVGELVQDKVDMDSIDSDSDDAYIDDLGNFKSMQSNDVGQAIASAINNLINKSAKKIENNKEDSEVVKKNS